MNSILKSIDGTHPEYIDDLLNNEKMFNIDQEEFKRSIEGNIYKKQYSRHLLLKLDFLLGDNTVHLSGYKYITVVHILPQNPQAASKWKADFIDEEREFWTNKIANLVLISQR